ncbi:TetR/AcrR family transcriptional regulator [Luteipulveratus mongoliensis]|uniref:TetR/AcrR family transcriptional regulator n=1 Tax=Luteipulveratus mongoliensis TaxID=571913 RepID=UPI0014707E46|nr:TetR/AcrR family transcriptional regulator [Luteipulveratus mongoliensis]
MTDTLIDATARVLGDVGYTGASTNRIAAEAGVSVGSLYRYFSDKDDLIGSLRERSSRLMTDALTEALVSATGLELGPGVRHVLQALVQQIDEHRAVIGALVDEMPLGAQGNVLPEIERQLSQYVRLFVVQHAPTLSRGEVDARIYLALGMALNSCLRIALELPDGLDADHLLDLTAELMVAALLRPE